MAPSSRPLPIRGPQSTFLSRWQARSWCRSSRCPFWAPDQTTLSDTSPSGMGESTGLNTVSSPSFSRSSWESSLPSFMGRQRRIQTVYTGSLSSSPLMRTTSPLWERTSAVSCTRSTRTRRGQARHWLSSVLCVVSLASAHLMVLRHSSSSGVTMGRI